MDVWNDEDVVIMPLPEESVSSELRRIMLTGREWTMQKKKKDDHQRRYECPSCGGGFTWTAPGWCDVCGRPLVDSRSDSD